MIIRIINTRKSKNFIFADVFNDEHEKLQVSFNKDLINKSLKIGDTLFIEGVYGKNNNGDDIFITTKVTNHFSHEKNMPLKSFKDGNIHGLANTLNGCNNLNIWMFKNDFVNQMRYKLIKENFMEVSTPIIMNNRGTSTLNPLTVNSKFNNDRYLKITHELELKKQCYLSLKPLFEIGFVTRDVYKTTKTSDQYLTMEAVFPSCNEFEISKFYQFMYETALELSVKHNLETLESFNYIEIFDVFNEYQKNLSYKKKSFLNYYKNLLEDNKNRIYLNAPIDSPLARKDELGIALETKWAVGKRGLGHGYLDEYEYDKIYSAFTNQINKEDLKNLDKDFLKILECAGFETRSFNLGIDRFIHQFLGLSDQEKSVKILERK